MPCTTRASLAALASPCWQRAARWTGGRWLQPLEGALGAEVTVQGVHDHAVFSTDGDGRAARQWIIDNVAGTTVLAQGNRIEMFKAVGYPDLVAEHYDLRSRSGTHALAHTRMATESAVTTNGSHPFSTGSDTCLVHNGSLSNHNRLRRQLEGHGESFQTENDSEVAAGYLAWRMRSGDSITEALEGALSDLDGFYTFAIGVADGFAILRDPIACKPQCRRDRRLGCPCRLSTGPLPACPVHSMPRCGNPSRRGSTPGASRHERRHSASSR